MMSVVVESKSGKRFFVNKTDLDWKKAVALCIILDKGLISVCL